MYISKIFLTSWSCSLHIGQELFLWTALSKHSVQNLCPHLVLQLSSPMIFKQIGQESFDSWNFRHASWIFKAAFSFCSCFSCSAYADWHLWQRDIPSCVICERITEPSSGKSSFIPQSKQQSKMFFCFRQASWIFRAAVQRRSICAEMLTSSIERVGLRLEFVSCVAFVR